MTVIEHDDECPECGLSAQAWSDQVRELTNDRARIAREHVELQRQLQGAVEALVAARKAIHDLCLERGSTEGYRDVFAAINVNLPTGGQ